MRYPLFIVFALLGLLGWGEAFGQDITFTKETFVDENMTLPYRKANISGLDDKASLVVYLHGGSSKGNDNETQMQEPGISAIGTWLADHQRKAIMLVPQCPTDKSWLGTTQDAMVRLLHTYIDRGVVDADKVYIFGGSMGGTGTWNMLSNHPDLFAAAMPVAGNPSGLDAEAVAATPLYTVMGTADKLMKISNVETFLKEMDNHQAEYLFDIEEGWTHEDVCKKSYTDDRLSWVFGHVRKTPSAIAGATQGPGEVVRVAWFTVNGQEVAAPPLQKGVYIKTSVYDNGSIASEKVCVR